MRRFGLALGCASFLACGPLGAQSEGAVDAGPTGPGTPGEVSVQFEHLVNGEPMVLDQGSLLEDGSPLTFAKVRYWISNVVFLTEDGSDHAVSDSYYLLEQTADAQRLDLNFNAVPAGRYRGLRFSVGVDEAHNHSLDTLAGELNADRNMSWNWNSGFIFLKAEGEVGLNAQGFEKPFAFHVGNDPNYKVVELLVEQGFEVGPEASVALRLKAELAHLFHSIDRAGNLSILGGTRAARIADNYAGMWTLEMDP